MYIKHVLLKCVLVLETLELVGEKEGRGGGERDGRRR